MKRALLVHCDIYGFGGAEYTAIKILRMLQDQGVDVTVLHAGGPLDTARIRDRTSIEIDERSARFIQAPIFARFPRLLQNSLLLRYAFVVRAARRIASDYDFVVATYGELPISDGHMVQVLHIPLFFLDRESLVYLGVRDPGAIKLAIRRAYVLAARTIAGWSTSAVEQHLLLTNSRWTAKQFARHYPNARIEAVYHGVTTEIVQGRPEYLDHDQRDNTIVVIGRVVPFKRVHLAIEIVDRLRARGHDLRLLIVGGGDGEYVRGLEHMCSTRPHVEWRRNMPRDDMERLIASKRWGLHAAEHEHYGLAPLELQRLGCVTFVHDSGGQVEVVQDPLLKYDSVDDAVAKIDALLCNPMRARALFERLPEAVSDHTSEGFRSKLIARLRQERLLDA